MKIDNIFTHFQASNKKSSLSGSFSLATDNTNGNITNNSYSSGNNLSSETTSGLIQAQEVVNQTGEPKSAREQFLEYMKMTPQERLFYAFLKNKEGLSKEEFEALPPEEQQRIKEEIQKEIKEKIETGQLDPKEIAFFS